jgi:HK97 family phage major capsid protein
MRRNALHRAMFERKNDPADGGAAGGSGAILEIKNLIQQQGTAWEEYKKTNDALLKAKAEGKAVGDLEAKLDKISKEMDSLAEIRSQIDQLTARFNRKGLGDDEASGDLQLECKAFNISRRSFVSNVNADVTVDEYKNYKTAFFKWARKGRLEALDDAERKSMLAGDDANGGYLLPPPTVGRIVKKIFELSPIRQIASVVSISTQALEGIYDNDEASVGYVGEVAARPNTGTPTLGKYRLEAFEIYANPKISQTLIDDAAYDVEGWLADKVANKLARFEGAEFVTGTGVNAIKGFTKYTLTATADGTRTWGQIEKIKTGVNGDFAASSPADKIFDLTQAFKPAYLNNAKWVTTREVVGKVRKFKGATTGDYLWQPGLQAGMSDKLLGYPIVMAQDLPALSTYATTSAPCLWLADWAEFYTIVDRMGIRTIRDNLTDKPNVQFYSTRRVGGGVLNFEAGKVLTFEA